MQIVAVASPSGLSRTTLYSVGHSTHSLAEFLTLLGMHDVEVIVDVRSVPASQRFPQFNRNTLAAELPLRGKKYLFLGGELGGRPSDPEMYDSDGYVLYDRLARTRAFEEGLARICDGARTYRIALLCSEEDPAACHRHILIGRVLVDRGVDVLHIRRDGTIQPASTMTKPTEAHQMTLFSEPPRAGLWRSPKPLWRVPDERLFDWVHSEERAPVF